MGMICLFGYQVLVVTYQMIELKLDAHVFNSSHVYRSLLPRVRIKFGTCQVSRRNQPYSLELALRVVVEKGNFK